MTDCVFCAILADAATGHVVHCRDHVLVLISLEGHPLVVPRRHVPHLSDLDDATAAAMMQTAARTATALRITTGCEGINLVLSDGAAAGQDVFHLHLHVKPRWAGDGTTLRWNTETVPEAPRRDFAAALARAIALRSD